MGDFEQRMGAIQERVQELEDRLNDLRERRRKLADKDSTVGSTFEEAHQATFFAVKAGARAAQSRSHSIQAHLAAARIHDQVAALYESLAGRGVGDLARYHQRAEDHRAGARQERAAAQREIVDLP